MNQTFDHVRDAVRCHAEQCWDTRLSSTQMRVEDDGSFLLRNGRESAEVVHPTQYAEEKLLGRLRTCSSYTGTARAHISRQALTHLCTRPSTSTHRGSIGALDTSFKAYIIRELLHSYHPGLRWLVRCRDSADGTQVMRAALSDKFRTFDHSPFLDAILAPQAGLGDVGVVKGFRIGDYADDLFLQVYFPDLKVVSDGHQYMPGFRFRNGECGNRTVGWDPFITTMHCNNVITIAREYSFSKRHVGTWRPRLIAAELAACAQDWFRESDRHIADLERLQDVAITDLRQVVENIKKERRLSDEDAGRLQGHIEAQSTGESTAYDVVQGVTAFAQTLNKTERRDDVEVYSGELYDQFVRAMKADRSAKITR